jgi:hypothetical protein
LKSLLTFFIAFTLYFETYAQTEKTISLCLTFQEVYSSKPLKARLVYQNHQVKFTVRDTCISVTLRPKRNYQIILEAEEYATAIIPIRDDTLRNNQTLYIEILPRTELLREVVVRPDNRMRYRGDTLVIDVDSVKMKPHGNTNDLLKKIPGIRITPNGGIEIAGNEVKSVTVNGYELFGGNARATLETIKGDMIKSLEVTAGSSPNSVSLNLRLKPNRDKGAFGEGNAGTGTRETYTGELRINKIAPQNFTNFFINGSNTSERIVNTKASEQINGMILNNELGGVYSPTVNQLEAYLDLYNQRSNVSTPNFSRDKGINNSLSGGLNLTKAMKRMSWSGFILADYTRQQLQEESTTFQKLSETTEQNSESKTQKDSKILQTWAAINGTIRPSRYDQVKVFSLFQLQNNDLLYNNQNRFILKENNSNLIDNQSIRNTIEQTNTIQGVQKLAWIHRYKKPDIVTAFYGAYHYTGKDFTQQYQNQLLGFQNHHQIQRSTPDKFLDLQFAQSYPVWKGKFLMETKAIYQDAITNINQDALRFNDTQNRFTDKISGLGILNFEVRDIQKEIQLNTYFLTQKSKLIIGLSLWNWQGSRNGFLPERNINLNKTKFIPTAFWRWNFSQDNYLTIFYNKPQQLPTYEQVYPIADSSMIQYTQVGNLNLQNYSKTALGLATRYVLKSIVTNFALNYTENENGIISKTTLNPNQTLTQTYIQDNVMKALSGRLSVLRMSRTKAGWSIQTSFNINESPSIYENQTVINQSLFGSISTGLKLKPIETISVDIDLQSLYTGQLKTNTGTWRTQINLKSEIELSYRTYLDLNLDVNLNRNTVGQNVNYPLCDVALSQFILKKNALKLTLKARNIFDVRNVFESYSFGNAQFQYLYNQMPQFFVLSGTFYLEKWSKK